LLLIRRLHTYLGLFIAPSVLFFAFSGACQVFSLHEAHGDYHPPALIETLGNLHKDQVLSKPEHHPAHAPSAGMAHDADAHAGAPDHDHDHDHGHADKAKASTLVLKWFFAGVAVCLAFSTLFGLWMGLRFARTPRLSWGLLVAGVVVPVLIVLL
jgi:hypothetical protein